MSLRFGGLQALADVGFEVAAGEVVAVIGPNGAGKTSLFNAITGYAGAISGSIALNGVGIAGMTPHAIAANGVRRTFQNGGLFGDLTVLENVLAGLHGAIGGNVLATLLRLPGIDRRERAATAPAFCLLEQMQVGQSRRPAGEGAVRRPAAHRRDRPRDRDHAAAAAARRARGRAVAGGAGGSGGDYPAAGGRGRRASC